MKKIIWITVVVLLVILAMIYGTKDIENDSKAINENEIKIGVIASLTGKGAIRGESVVSGVELALSEIKKTPFGDKITIVYQDVPLDGAKDAPGAFNYLVGTERVDAIIGPMGSSVVLSVSTLVDQYQIPMIAHTASAKSITENNDYVFRLWPISQDYAEITDQEIVKRGYKEIGILTATSDNTVELQELMLDMDEKNDNYKISIVEEVTIESTDFRTSLLKIKEAGVDAIFLNLFEGQFSVAGRQLQDLEINVPLFANSVLSESEIPNAGTALEGTWMIEFNEYTQSVKEKYVKKFGSEPASASEAIAAHDALIALAEAFEKSNGDSIKANKYLYENPFQGLMGDFSFKPSGDANVPLSLFEVKNGVLEKIIN